MKELLKKFYEIDIEDYYEVEDGYLFYLYGQLFYFYKLDNACNLDVVKEIYNYVCLKSNIRLHCIVYNIFNEYVSDGYILMKVNVLIDDIEYYDVMLFNNFNMNELNKYFIDIRSYWMNRLDMLEKDINNYNYDVRYDFYYYMGIIEMLLSNMEDVDKNKIDVCLSHNRICNNSISFYNPFNLCVDLRYKDLLFYLVNNDKLEELYKYTGYVSDYDMKYIVLVLLIPYSYFYDMDNYVSNINDYEIYIGKVVDILGHKKRGN